MKYFQAPYLLYVEVLDVENPQTSQVPSKILENTLRHTRSEDDLSICYTRPEGSPHAEFNVYGNYANEFDDPECWSQEDDDILQVISVDF